MEKEMLRKIKIQMKIIKLKKIIYLQEYKFKKNMIIY